MAMKRQQINHPFWPHIKPSARYRKSEKRLKSRAERRRARQDPETIPCYGIYVGWF